MFISGLCEPPLDSQFVQTCVGPKHLLMLAITTSVFACFPTPLAILSWLYHLKWTWVDVFCFVDWFSALTPQYSTKQGTASFVERTENMIDLWSRQAALGCTARLLGSVALAENLHSELQLYLHCKDPDCFDRLGPNRDPPFWWNVSQAPHIPLITCRVRHQAPPLFAYLVCTASRPMFGLASASKCAGVLCLSVPVGLHTYTWVKSWPMECKLD